jgi:4-aminobutyrate aminotransferase
LVKGIFPFFNKKKKTDELPSNQLPKIRTKTVPGPRSLKLTEALKRYECPQITYVGDGFPVFLERASGANVWDTDGNRYLDLTSFFGVMGVGHSSKEVVDAVRRQAGRMLHGMGDVHPSEGKVALAQRLAEITPGNLSQTIFSSTGAEAVETALKTAVMHTKKTGVIAFTGAYHGLTYGTLHVTHRDDFRKPFLKQLGKHAYFAPFPDTRLHGNKAAEVSLKVVESITKKARRSGHAIGAILIEPIQGRGGVQVPPSNFLKGLREFCDKHGIVLIADEVFTGFARTGSLFSVEKSGIVPDLLCVGKGMAAGMPLSACIGSPKIMHSWGASTGDAIHTSTYLGHPLACAAALAVIREIETKKLVDRSQRMGELFRRELHKLKFNYPVIGDVRGSGLMIGLEFVDSAPQTLSKKSKKPALPPPATGKARRFVREALANGVILLSSGPNHNVISITPPFVISEKEILWCVKLFESILRKIG